MPVFASCVAADAAVAAANCMLWGRGVVIRGYVAHNMSGVACHDQMDV
jgi:hypothetical protein